MPYSFIIPLREGQLWKDLARDCDIIVITGYDAFYEGDKNTLAAHITMAGRYFPEQVVTHIRAIVEDIEPQPKDRDRNSGITLSPDDLPTWNWLSDQLGTTGKQLVRRIAAAYERNPAPVRSHMRSIAAMVDQPGDLKDLYAKAIPMTNLKRLLDEIEFKGDVQVREKGRRISPIVPPRTRAILLLSLLTGLRSPSILHLCFKHVHRRNDGALVIDTPDTPERKYVVYDQRLHEALRDCLESSGQPGRYARLGTEAGALQAEEQLWPLELMRLDEPRKEAGLSKWSFLKPLNRYAERVELPPINQSDLFATYAQLLAQKIQRPLDLRPHLIPVGDRTTDIEIRLPW